MAIESGQELLHYRLIEKIGEGGDGRGLEGGRHERSIARWRSRSCPTPSRPDPERLARFEREAKLLAAL